jgi:hypothetical protein
MRVAIESLKPSRFYLSCKLHPYRCCDPWADPVDTGSVLVHMLDHTASVLTDPKRVTAVIYSIAFL